MIKYGIIGSHGTGKSTLAYMLATHFKKAKKNVDTIQERVRYSPFPFNADMTVDTALWVYHSHIARELEAKARGFDTVICDRTPLDSFVYAEYFNLDDKEYRFCRHHAIKWLETYQQIFFVNFDTEIVPDGTRGIDPEYQSGIDKLYRDYIDLIDKYLKVNITYINSSDIFKEGFNISNIIGENV